MESNLYDESTFDRDREYWNRFYSSAARQLSMPSDFAVFVADYLTVGKHLLELGCGNGRDSFLFLKLGLRVTGIDASDYIIKILNNNILGNEKALFICDDFVKFIPKNTVKYDYVYSRFTLHAISECQEDQLLKNMRTFLTNDGIFFVEARTVNDDLYGKGIRVNKNAFIYDDHYRRFIDANEFRIKLERMKFEILLFEEKTGFSKTESSDPMLMRCIARLNKD